MASNLITVNYDMARNYGEIRWRRAPTGVAVEMNADVSVFNLFVILGNATLYAQLFLEWAIQGSELEEVANENG